MADRNVKIHVTQDGNAKAELNALTGALGAFGIALSARAVVDFTKETYEMGQEQMVARAALEATTGSLENANRVIAEVQAVTDGMVNKTEAAAGANVLLASGLAQSGAEAGKLIEAGAILTSIFEASGASQEKFVRLLQSGNRVLLDNFGLTQGMVNAKQREIEATTDLSGQEARLQAIRELLLESADKYVKTIPESVKASKELEVAWADLRAEAGERLTPTILELNLALLDFITGSHRLEEGLVDTQKEIIGATDTYGEYLKAIGAAEKVQGAQHVVGQRLTLGAYQEAKALQHLADFTDESARATRVAAAANAAYVSSVDTADEAVKNYNENYYTGMTSAAYTKMVDQRKKVLDAEQDSYNAIARARQDLNDRLSDLDTQAGYDAVDHANRMASIQAEIAEASTAGIESRQRGLYDQLRSLAESHADRLKSIKASLTGEETDYDESKADKAQDFQEKITDFTEDHETRRAELVARLAGVRSSSELWSLKDQITKEDAEYTKELARKQDRQAIEVARDKREHDEKVAQLQARLAEEDAEYKKQQGEAKKRAAEDLARIRAENAERVAGLQVRLAQEEESYKRQQAALQKSQDDAHKQFEAVQASENKSLENMRKLLEELTKAWKNLITGIPATISASVVPGSYAWQASQYQMGTPYVPRDQLAFLHKGEAVIPAGANRGGDVNVTLVYSPMISLADQYELEHVLMPFIQAGVRRAQEGAL